MIKHIVTFKFSGEPTERAESATTAKRELEALVPLIPEVSALVVGIDTSPAETHWDAVLVSDFATQSDLDIYQKHPEHQRVLAIVAALTELRSIADYEY